MWDEWNEAGKGAEHMCGYCRTLMCGRHRAEIRAVCLREALASEILSHRSMFFASPQRQREPQLQLFFGRESHSSG